MAPDGEIMIAAGDASGELHAAALVRELKALDPSLSFFGFGGQILEEAGVELIADAGDINVMGLTEILPAVGRIVRTWRTLRKALARRRPRALIVVDFPEFNLRLGRAAKKMGIKTVYYVVPQVWAWRTWRVRLLRKFFDLLMVIFPFEVELYRRRFGLETAYPGHPFADLLPLNPQAGPDLLRELDLDPTGLTVGLLPGSRQSELKYNLPLLAETARIVAGRHPEAQFVIPVAPGLDRPKIQAAFSGLKARAVAGRAREALKASTAALVCSGTASLEAAWCGTPAVVFYTGSYLTYLIVKMFIGEKKIDHFAMPNLIAGWPVYPELIPYYIPFSPKILADQLEPLIGQSTANHRAVRAEMLLGLKEVRERLGRPGAARRAAEMVLAVISGTL